MIKNEGENVISIYSTNRKNISNNINNNPNNKIINNNTEINQLNNNEGSNIPKPKINKSLIIAISVASVLVITAIVVPIIVLTNKEEDTNNINTTYVSETNNITETNELIYSNIIKTEFKDDNELYTTNNNFESEKNQNVEELTNNDILETNKNEEIQETTIDIHMNPEVIKLSIDEIKKTKYCIYSTLKLKCNNLNLYPEIQANDISLEFPIEGSTQKYYSDSINENIIEKKIPPEVISGNIILSIEKLNFIYEFSLDIIKEIKIKFKENIKFQFGSDMTISNDNITRCKNNYSIVYSFIAPAEGIYDVELSSSIAVKEPCYLYADIDYDLTSAIRKGRNVIDLVKKPNSTRFSDFQKTIHGSFSLEENKEYFLKIAFLKNTGMHTYNINGIRVIPNPNQNKKTFGMGYALYKLDFQNEMFYPFYPYWATPPNYIKVENEYGEFYYNQEAYDEHYGQRHYKGADITAYYSTIRDGWYGYRFYLTDVYPKDANTSIINQIFNNNRLNTWAGHMHMRQNHLWMTHRYAAYYKKKTHVDFGEIEWNKWYNIIIYFKVGLEQKGRIKVWVGQGELKEDEPTYDSGGVDFGFGSWIDNETLDNTKVEENGKINQIQCKFGMYTWDGGDKIIRYKNISALEYNPVGAFDIVNPCKNE